MAGTDCTRAHTCAHCGAGFAPHKSNHKYCSQACSHAAYRIRKTHDPAGHKCAECGARFTGRKRKYCSDECATEAHRKQNARRKGRDPGPRKYKRVAQRLEYPPGVETENDKRVWRYNNDPDYRAKETKRRKKYLTPTAKRMARFRAARRQGRAPQYKPLNDGERAIWQAHKAQIGAWRRYLRACERIDNPPEPSPYDLMTDAQARQSNARNWRWRYANEPEFRARVKAASKAKKYRRRLQKAATDDGTVTPDLYNSRRDCLYCGAVLTDKSRSVDHMVPLSLGGMHSAANITECCRSCNSQKNAKPFDEWLDQLEEPYRSRAEREYIRKQSAHPKQLTLTAVAPAP